MSETTTADALDRAIGHLADCCDCWGLAMGRSHGGQLQEATTARAEAKKQTAAAFTTLVAERDAAVARVAVAQEYTASFRVWQASMPGDDPAIQERMDAATVAFWRTFESAGE